MDYINTVAPLFDEIYCYLYKIELAALLKDEYKEKVHNSNSSDSEDK